MRLLGQRAAGATICPSEAARALCPDGDWRSAMGIVHEAVDALNARGRIALSWKGAPLERRRGPYRIAARR